MKIKLVLDTPEEELPKTIILEDVTDSQYKRFIAYFLESECYKQVFELKERVNNAFQSDPSS